MTSGKQIRAEMPATYEELAEEYVRLRKRIYGLEKKCSKIQNKFLKEREINDSRDNAATLVRELYEENTHLGEEAVLWKKRYKDATDVLKGKLAELGKQYHQNNLILLVRNLIFAYEEKLGK